MRDTRSKIWAVRAAILVSIALSGAAAVAVVLQRLEALSAPVPTALGLRLGSTVDEVRAVRGAGEWTTRVDATGDLEIARGEERYSFHEGLLVAVDALVLPADGEGPPFELSDASVLVREPVGGRIRVRLVSRTCPTHAEAANALVDRVDR
jgi:hypothetical protein